MQASIGAGVLLTAAGLVSLRSAVKPAHRPFAAIPLLFATQQFSEAFLWSALDKGTVSGLSAMYMFLFFAQVVWPSWVPLSIWLLEKEARRKKILFGVLCIGLFTSMCLAYFLFAYPVSAQIQDHHIFYRLDFPAVSMKLGLLYFVPTVISSFLSSHRGVQAMGLAILTSFIVSKVFFKEELISVWCYFAAVISVVIVFIMRDIKKSFVTATG